MDQEKARMTDENKNKINDNEEESTIFTAPTATETFDKKRKKNLLKKQWLTVAIVGAVLVILISLYVAFNLYVKHIAALYEADKSITENNAIAAWIIENIVRPEPEEELPELLPGEGRAPDGGILVFDYTERANIYSIDVYNGHGHYGFRYDSVSDDFFVTDHPSAPYDRELFSSLVVGTGFTVVTERVTEECRDFSEYGLSESDSPAYYELTTRKGDTHTVYVGDPTPAGNGYYVRYAGRDAVYILGTDFSKTLLAPLENLITPSLTLPMAQNDYFMVENFTVVAHGNPVVSITYRTEEELAATTSQNPYKMLYPEGYSANSSGYVEVMSTFIDFKGHKTVVYAPDTEDMEKYGLLEPAYSVSYTYKGIHQPIVFSEKNSDGNYYAYSPTFDLIAEVSASAVKWLEWETIQWIDDSLFMMNIDDVSTIKIESDKATRIFDLEGKKDKLVVTERTTGFKPEVQNFRQFYKTILYVGIQGYASDDIGEEELEKLTSEDKNCMLTMTIETFAGDKLVYKFYPYSTRRAYFILNGKGEFSVLRDMVMKVIDDGEKVMTNTEIDAEAHS